VELPGRRASGGWKGSSFSGWKSNIIAGTFGNGAKAVERARQSIFRTENEKSGLDSGYSTGEGNLPYFEMTKN